MKNKLMRAATLLLVLTLMTSCFVGSTFAKYTTSSTGSDQARVAYWGFKAPAEMNIALFENAYDAGAVKGIDADNDGTPDDVIAPGTKDSHEFGFAYVNYDATTDITAPEVKYTFTVDVSQSVIADDIRDNPSIVWALDPADPEDAADYGSWNDMLNGIKALSGDASGSKTYNPGELPAAFAPAATHTVYWMWKFDGNDSGDTIMGNKTALDQVKLAITITATQLDS